MRTVNPAFIPRNHRVEAVISAAVNNDDYAPFEELLTLLSKPYEDQPAYAAYAEPPLPEQRVTADVLRDVRRPSIRVIASEAKQSISPCKERMDCFVASLLAMTALPILRIVSHADVNRTP